MITKESWYIESSFAADIERLIQVYLRDRQNFEALYAAKALAKRTNTLPLLMKRLEELDKDNRLGSYGIKLLWSLAKELDIWPNVGVDYFFLTPYKWLPEVQLISMSSGFLDEMPIKNFLKLRYGSDDMQWDEPYGPIYSPSIQGEEGWDEGFEYELHEVSENFREALFKWWQQKR